MLRLILILTISITCLAQTPECKLDECLKSIQEPSTEQIINLVLSVDEQIKRIYWYYLRGGKIIYQANINTPQKLILFFIYRNRLGTFLTVAEWSGQEKKIDVQTLVRLGNGFTRDEESSDEPLQLNPFMISVKLSEDQFVVELDDEGNFFVNGELMIERDESSKSVQSLKENLDPKSRAGRKRLIEAYLQKKYWHYLSGAKNIYDEEVETNQRTYVMITYVNVVGTFLAISSLDREVQKVEMNTMVRLGAGTTDPTNIEPLSIAPSVLELPSHDDL